MRPLGHERDIAQTLTGSSMPDAFTQTGYIQQRDAEIQKSWEKQFAKRDGKKRSSKCKYCSWHGKQWRRVACTEQVAANKAPTDSVAADTAASGRLELVRELVAPASILAEGNPLKSNTAASDRYEEEELSMDLQIHIFHSTIMLVDST